MHSARIIILANKYPSVVEPNVNVFTQQLAWSFADLGYECVIVCPTAMNYNKRNALISEHYQEMTERGNYVGVFRPRYIGFGQNGSALLKVRVDLTTRAYKRAVTSVLDTLRVDSATVLFAEFLCPAGVVASLLGGKYNVRSYMQCGEATYQGDKKYGNRKLREKLLRGLSGVIALSGQNRDFLVNASVVPQDKVIVLPSGYRRDRIVQRDKAEARRRLGFPENKFIVGFCGSFDDRKGILRLEQAIDFIDDPEICLAAVGQGDCMPKSAKCIWNKPIDHALLSWFYSAIDVFAFPTYHEGCCTAIVEAIACGCPIISSDRPFNYEICDASNSILIDPDDIEAMSEAIVRVRRDDVLRLRLAKGSTEMARSLDLDEKARRVAAFMGV